jgi:hypothetical protein
MLRKKYGKAKQEVLRLLTHATSSWSKKYGMAEPKISKKKREQETVRYKKK